jgi:predicted AAA+ superfamily ATPase
VNNLDQSIQSSQAQFIKNYVDLSNNIKAYTDMTKYLEENNSVYHYNDDQDPLTIVKQKTPKDLKSVLNEDVNQLKLYQNTVYISGTIAIATLVIGIILIGQK